MKLDYTGFWETLENKNIGQGEIKQRLKLSGGTMDSLRHNNSITTETLGKICEFLKVQPSDILKIEYDEESYLKLKAQIAELQEKLKQYEV